jgi:hypothetical protein
LENKNTNFLMTTLLVILLVVYFMAIHSGARFNSCRQCASSVCVCM